jgi:hypothetical protein
MTAKYHSDVADAVAAMNAATTKGRGRKAPVYRWLRSRYDELVVAFAENAPAWGALAQYLGSIGVTNQDGSLPAGEGVRSAWKRVVADAAKRSVHTPTPTAPAGPEASAQPLVKPATKMEADDGGRPKIKWTASRANQIK